VFSKKKDKRLKEVKGWRKAECGKPWRVVRRKNDKWKRKKEKAECRKRKAGV